MTRDLETIREASRAMRKESMRNDEDTKDAAEMLRELAGLLQDIYQRPRSIPAGTVTRAAYVASAYLRSTARGEESKAS